MPLALSVNRVKYDGAKEGECNHDIAGNDEAHG